MPGPNFKSVHQKEKVGEMISKISKQLNWCQNSIMHMKLRFNSMSQNLLKLVFSKFELVQQKMKKVQQFLTNFNKKLNKQTDMC
jgi:hypothetical protein